MDLLITDTHAHRHRHLSEHSTNCFLALLKAIVNIKIY
jgi:hypothetical protein